MYSLGSFKNSLVFFLRVLWGNYTVIICTITPNFEIVVEAPIPKPDNPIIETLPDRTVTALEEPFERNPVLVFKAPTKSLKDPYVIRVPFFLLFSLKTRNQTIKKGRRAPLRSLGLYPKP